MKSKPTVEPSGFEGPGPVVACPGGVIYTNQVAGLACLHPSIEGVFVPLPQEPGRTELYKLQQHFRGSWHPLTAEDADVVDRILRRGGFDFVRVDRGKMSSSYEAWVHVSISHRAETLQGILVGFGDCDGVLTWPNGG